MIRHYMTNYLMAKVLLEEMDCKGYRQGKYKIRFIRIVKTYYWR